MKIFLTILFLLLAVLVAPRIIRYVRMKRYFASEEFLTHKKELLAVVAEHNDIARYTAEIQGRGSFQLGASSTGSHAHLAYSQNTSRHKYRRDKNVAHLQAPNVHNCSLQVARNAEIDPIKYVMKYFNIRADEGHLAAVERLGNDIARLESAVHNLQQREASVAQSFRPPTFIRKHYWQRFMQHVGFQMFPLYIPYPVYFFEYVSAGGNSSERTVVELNGPMIDTLIEVMGQKIRFRKSAAGQRALMTAKLRHFIKSRDNFTCRNCGVSVAAEPHLLLEVDHMVPVSRGGLSTPGNLQTLCWRCNRTKSNKMMYA